MTRELTRKGVATRQRIVEGAADEIRAHGLAAVTLDDIRARTGTSKSQLFHYFPAGKDELLLAVARHEADRVLTDQEPALSELTSWPAWQSWRDTVVARYRRQGTDCPLGGLVAHLGQHTPGAQAVVTELLRDWRSRITAGIRAMQDRDLVAADLDADRTAAAILAGIQGGVLVMLSTGEIDHLEAALDLGISYLRTTSPTNQSTSDR